jgi:adenylylsulfate kinase-like enzyme
MSLLRAVVLNGTCGSGKTTTGETVAEVLADGGDAVAFVDVDALGIAWPRPADDPYNVRLAAKNLGSMAENFAAAGVRSLVVASVVQNETDLARYSSALGQPLAVVRLVAPLGVIDERLRLRHGDADPDGMAWHRARAPELDRLLDEATFPMTVVENSGTKANAARAVLDAIGWQL